MSHEMLRRIAIWIDQTEAILFTFQGERVAEEERLLSEAGPHTRGGGWSQRRIEAQRHEQLKHYYEEVVQHLGPVDEILILGPGQAKHDLHRSIQDHRGMRGMVVAVHSTSRLTEPELMDEAERLFALELAQKGS
jgi:peptide subunit release factor 1 (eRF1)